MDFKTATDRLMEAGVSAGEIADALGLAAQTVRAMRLDPSSPSYRRAQPGWRKELAPLARSKGRELGDKLEALARELEEGPSE